MGAGWHTQFDKALIQSGIASSVKFLHKEDGSRIKFTYDPTSSKWLPEKDMGHYRLQNILDPVNSTVFGYSVIYNNDSKDIFNKDGRLIETYDEVGNKVYTITYLPSGQIDKVSDFTARELVFQYNTDGKLFEVHAPLGIFKYEYDPVTGLLDKVTYPDSTYRKYHYNEQEFTQQTSLPNALTGITIIKDGNEVRYATFTYDAQGRATSTYHAGNADKVTIAYDDTNQKRTITNSRNEISTYTYTENQGVKLPDTISGAGCANCSHGDVDYQFSGVLNYLLTKTEQNMVLPPGILISQKILMVMMIVLNVPRQLKKH